MIIGILAIGYTIVGPPSLDPGISPGAAATPPDARPGYAVVGLFVGGDRISETQVDGLGGATFGFFTSRPTSVNEETGVVTDTPAYTCVSDSDGWCSVTIPIPSGTTPRYWVAPTAVPSGWYGNPYWQTAPLSPSATAPRYQTQHVFQTPPLASGGRYLSTDPTNQFMSDPNIATSDTAFNNANGGTTGSGVTTNNFMRRTASSGVWPLIHANPPLVDKCGINVALIVDLSSSVVGHMDGLKSSMDSFVEALRGTPSQISLTTFGSGSPANGFPGTNTGLMSVATTADANRVEALYSGWGNPPTNYTNWDAGLNRVASEDNADNHIDLAVVLTDGNPTVYGDIAGAQTSNPTIPAGSGFTRFREMENATASANALKAQNTRVVAVGVGDGLDAGSARNLRTISGPVAYGSGLDIADADYLQATSYDEAGDDLHRLVLGMCAPSISVVKRIIPYGGDIGDAYTPGSTWDFTASTQTPGASVGPPPGQPSVTQSTDLHTGGTNFDVTVPDSNGPGTFDVAETPHPDYTLAPVSSDGSALDPDGQNAFCVDKSNDDRPVAVTGTGPTSFSADLSSDTALSCVVYNQAPDFSEASVLVHKRWRLTTASGTTTYDQGDQPEDLEASLRLGGPAPAGLSDQSWGVVRHGYTGRDTVTPPGIPGENVDVGENVRLIPSGCKLTSATMSGTGIDGDQDLGTTDPQTTVNDIRAGLNEWTITNSVDCRSHLTLRKEVHGGPASPDAWTLHAHGASGALAGPSGTTGVSGEVTPEETYQLAEEHGDDPELLNYVQPDERSRPIQHPQSTGSTDCIQTEDGAEQPGAPTGVEGAVSVPLGQSYTCTFTNTAAPLHVIKDVDGGDAAPGDFRFSVVPVPPHPDGLPERHFDGAAAPGYGTIVRPGQTYRITEVGGPDGYQLLGLDCNGAGRSGTTFTVPAGSSAACTAHNSFSRWTAEKSSDPEPGEIRPGTVITYKLAARVLEGNPTHDVVVTDDLAGVLPHADFVHDSIDASAGSAHLDGQRVVWNIPVLHGAQTVTFRVRVHDDAYGATLANQLGTHTTSTVDPDDPAGEPDRPGVADDGDQAVDCSTLPGGNDVPGGDCNRTVHTVPDRPGATVPGAGPGTALPGTGGPALSWLLAGSLLAAGGTALVAYGRRRRP